MTEFLIFSLLFLVVPFVFCCKSSLTAWIYHLQAWTISQIMWLLRNGFLRVAEGAKIKSDFSQVETLEKESSYEKFGNKFCWQKPDGEEKIVAGLNSVLNKASYQTNLKSKCEISASYWMCDTVFSCIHSLLAHIGRRDNWSGMWQNLSWTG